MTSIASERGRRTRRRRGGEADTSGPVRRPNYRQLHNPFVPQKVFSDDAVEAMHDTAMSVIENLGIKILLPEAREVYKAGGALVDEDEQMVRIGRDIVEASLASAPKSFRLRAPNPEREQVLELGRMLFGPGAGCPHATDRERGRRPGSLEDYEETTKLQQSFDAIHKLGPSAEPQDVPVHIRHYAMMRAQLAFTDKPIWVFSRGRRQVAQCFEMIKLAHQLDDEAFEDGAWATTVINTNSPRQIDVPMALGLIDFARANQVSVITPFCLAGAMAPITVAGALVLQHAEALAAIVLTQLARPGAPVVYGAFSSNVDMKSGAPAFGTPAHIQASLGSGQLARRIGLPWRNAAGSAGNTSDAQASVETVMSLWGAVMSGATLIYHAAGWLEGGLTFGYEKFVNDLEALQELAELCVPPAQDTAAFGFDAIAEVQPGGHFFAAAHTMERYQTAFYEPLVADLSNYGTWSETGELTSTERATKIWKKVLEEFEPPPTGPEAEGRIADFIAKGIEAGGAPVDD